VAQGSSKFTVTSISFHSSFIPSEVAVSFYDPDVSSSGACFKGSLNAASIAALVSA
jgi:hypothetical protein